MNSPLQQPRRHLQQTELPDANALAEKLYEQLASIPDIKEYGCIGIERGGMVLARWLHQKLQLRDQPGSINNAFHRDDFSYKLDETADRQPAVGPSSIPFATGNAKLLVVDDVCMTGRTLRAAINEIFDFGRPAIVRFACLVDLNLHQLPIRPDFVAASLHLPDTQRIKFVHRPEGGFQFCLQQPAS